MEGNMTTITTSDITISQLRNGISEPIGTGIWEPAWNVETPFPGVAGSIFLTLNTDKQSFKNLMDLWMKDPKSKIDRFLSQISLRDSLQQKKVARFMKQMERRK